MSQYQQYYSRPPQHQPAGAQPPISPSSYYASRPRPYASQAQPQAQGYDPRQQRPPPPPQHPVQQRRSPQPRAAQLPAQPQAYGSQRPPTTYSGVQQPYQPPYAPSSVQSPTRYTHQFHAQAPPQPAAPYAHAQTYQSANQVQRTYSYPPPSQPTAPYQAQAPHAGGYAPQPTPAAAPAPQYQAPVDQYGRPVTQPAAPVQVIPTTNGTSAPGRRPLPTPASGASPARGRPLSMPPPQTQTQPYSSFNHSSSSSLSHIIPQSSFPQSTFSNLPSASCITSSFPSQQRSDSPTRRPLPSPSPAPQAPAATSIPRTIVMNFSPTKPVRPSASGSQESSTPRRALPHSPTAPPDISQLQLGAGGPARRGTVSAMVSRFGGVGAEAGVSNPASQTYGSQAPPASSFVARSPVNASTLPATIQPSQASSNSSYNQQALSQSPEQSEEDDYPDGSFEDEDASSAAFDDEVASDGMPPTSPQYGIRDLPKRTAFASNSRPTGANVQTEPPSPQYGIRDLPSRAKSVSERKRVWEQGGQTSYSTLPKPPAAILGQNSFASPLKSSAPAPSSPTKASSPSKFTPAALPAPPPIIAPSRSPQPQTPKQEQKLPMPPVRQPQPSRTERQPSWTLPTADLEKIEAKTHPDGRQTSMAFRFAAMELSGAGAPSKDAHARASGNASAPPSWANQQPTSPMKQAMPPAPPAMPASTSASRSSSPTKSYPFAARTPRANANLDLNLDDAPPPSLRRSPSPSPSTASSSVPSIPTIRTPDDGTGAAYAMPAYVAPAGPGPTVPKISLPDDTDYDDDFRSIYSGYSPGRPSSSVMSPKVASPRATVPMINLPDDDYDDPAENRGLMISSAPPSTQPPLPVILNDLASPPSSTPTKSSRSLPRPPGVSASSIPSRSNTVAGPNGNVRSRGGGLVCGGCHAGILGRIVSAMGFRWHPQCFKCCTCGELLEHVSSYENDGKPYCHLDYHELFAPRCYHCKTPIIDERFITLDDPALGKRTYHEQHFFCAECGDPFLAPSISSNTNSNSRPNEISIKGDGAFDLALDEDGEEVGFTVFRGHPYCEACHVRLRAPKCKACKRSIRDGMRAVEALGGKWCFECFVCAGCEKPFEDPSFFQRDKKPFCEQCFSLILRNEV